MLIKKMAPLVAALAAGGIAVAAAQASTSQTTSGFTTQVVSHTVSGGQYVGNREGSVSCPTGTRVTGGGFHLTYSDDKTRTTESRPHGNGWFARVVAGGGITIYAVCGSG
jgi:hypothetical protein